jgi:ABC-2 type transport system permease protein
MNWFARNVSKPSGFKFNPMTLATSIHRIRTLLAKELAQIKRDRSLVGILIVAPIFQLMIMGFAANTDIRDIQLMIRDNDHSFHSRDFIQTLGASGYFKISVTSGPERDDSALLVSGKASLILVIPPLFSKQLLSNQPATVQVLVDGSDSNFGVIGLNTLQKATRQYSQKHIQLATATLNRQGVRLPTLMMESRAWYNPDLRSRYYMVPALMGVLLLVTTMLVTSMALVKEREDGTMEQLIVTPLRPMELMIGKLLPFVFIGLIEVTLALGVIRGVFDIPLRGSLFLLYAFSGLFLLTTLGMGLLISTLVKTQQQAMMIAAFFVLMPFVLLSGFIFPVENMPPPIQLLAALIPLKYYLEIVRGLFLKGTGLAELWQPALVLLVWGLGILTIAAFKFRQKMD